MGLENRLRERGMYQDVELIAKRHGTTVQEMASRSRASQVQSARVECYVTLSNLGWSSPQIAALFDRDHSTILSALKRTTAARILVRPVIGADCPRCNQPIRWVKPDEGRRATYAFGQCGCPDYWRLTAARYSGELPAELVREQPVEVHCRIDPDRGPVYSDGDGGPERTFDELLETIITSAKLIQSKHRGQDGGR